MRKARTAVNISLRTPLTESVLAHLKEILLCPKQADLAIAVSMLGGSSCRTSEGVAATVAALRRWVLVVVGPEAEKMWKHEEVRSAEDGTSHAAACCYLCLEYAVYGSCSGCGQKISVGILLLYRPKRFISKALVKMSYTLYRHCLH